MAEKLNFNVEIPENHSYCVTALNDKHASVINPETNSIVKTDKLTLFDQLLVSYLEKLDKITKNTKLKKEEREEYTNTVKNLRELLFQNRKYMKRYYDELNYISYNNKDLIQKTWSSLKNKQQDDNKEFKRVDFNEISDDSDTENSEDEEIKRKQEKLKKIFENPDNLPIKSRIIAMEDSNDSTLSSDSDDDNEEIPDSVQIEIKIKSKSYIVKDSNVYDKITGEYYGIYTDGKVKRKPNPDIDV